MVKMDLVIVPGDRVVLQRDGCCRAQEKVVLRVDEVSDLVVFTDGTTYHHADDPTLVLCLRGADRPMVLLL